jgi:hypothetical protein
MRREGRLERVGPTNSKGEVGPTLGGLSTSLGRPTQRIHGASGRLECAGPTGRGRLSPGPRSRHALKGTPGSNWLAPPLLVYGARVSERRFNTLWVPRGCASLVGRCSGRREGGGENPAGGLAWAASEATSLEVPSGRQESAGPSAKLVAPSGRILCWRPCANHQGRRGPPPQGAAPPACPLSEQIVVAWTVMQPRRRSTSVKAAHDGGHPLERRAPRRSAQPGCPVSVVPPGPIDAGWVLRTAGPWPRFQRATGDTLPLGTLNSCTSGLAVSSWGAQAAPGPGFRVSCPPKVPWGTERGKADAPVGVPTALSRRRLSAGGTPCGNAPCAPRAAPASN